MPRQFFTLKSLLTAQPGVALGSGMGIGASAVLEESSTHASQSVAVHDLTIFDVDDMPEGQPPQALQPPPSRQQAYEDHHYADSEAEEYGEEDLIGAPSAYDEEVVVGEGQLRDDDEQEIMLAEVPMPQAPPPPSMPAPVATPPPPVARFANIVTYDGEFEPVKNQIGQILGQSLNDVMRLRARAAEAFERKAEEMLGDLACMILGRELRTDPADLANLIAQMRGRMLTELPVQIRVSPEDAAYIAGPVVADPELSFGDLVFDVEDGEIDLRLGTRIAALLRSQHVEL